MKRIEKIATALLLIGLFLGMGACMKEDIDEIREELQKQDERLSTLEQWQKSVNTDILSLQSLIEAFEGKDYVTGVTALTDGTGYVISFSESGDVTIKHGERGEDGDTPVISVRQDTDEKYYWTVNGEWLLDGGNKMLVTGDKGTDAIAPQVRINPDSNEWEISVDSGTTWTSTGVKATGDSMFREIDNTNENYVELTLADGVTKIKLPKYVAFSIAFESDEVFYASPSDNELTLVLPATLKESDYRSIVATVTATNGADVQTRGSGNQWSVTVTKPTFGTDSILVEGSAKVAITGTENTRIADTYLLRVALVATNGMEVSASRLVKYFDGEIVKTEGSGVQVTDSNVERLAVVGAMVDEDFTETISALSNLKTLDLTMAEVVEIPYWAMRSSTSLQKVWLPVTARTLGEFAFYGCKGLIEVDLANIETIENQAFQGCSRLREIDIPATVKTLGRWVFQESPLLTTVTLHEGLTTLSESTFYGSSITEIHIPTTVTEIPAWCFKLCENLERIYLHDGITSMGQQAFSYCYSLERFTIPKGVTVLSDDLFTSCRGLREVNLHENITAMKSSVFYECRSLTFCSIPEQGQNLLPANLTEIGELCFMYTALKQMNMKDTQIKTIPDWAFYLCENLDEITLPSGLETIGNNVFTDCAFTFINLPASLKEIKGYTFTGCDDLRFVTCLATTPPTLGTMAFPNKVYCLKVPNGYVGPYQATSWYNYFENIEVMQ